MTTQDELIEGLQKKLERTKLRMEDIMLVLPGVHDIISNFEPHVHHIGTSLDWWDDHIQVSFSGKHELAAPILRAFAAQGWRQVEKTGKSLENRTWTLRQSANGPKVRVSLTATNARCVQVQVGTRVEPVYEYRCEQIDSESEQ